MLRISLSAFLLKLIYLATVYACFTNFSTIKFQIIRIFRCGIKHLTDDMYSQFGEFNGFCYIFRNLALSFVVLNPESRTARNFEFLNFSSKIYVNDIEVIF